MSFSDLWTSLSNLLTWSSTSAYRPDAVEFSSLPVINSLRQGYSPANRDRMVEKLRGFHELARDFICTGVEADEGGQPQKALPYYRKSLEAISEALSITFYGQQPADIERRRLEMARWKSMVTDRLLAIENPGSSQARSPLQISKSASGRFSFGHGASVPRQQRELGRQGTARSAGFRGSGSEAKGTGDGQGGKSSLGPIRGVDPQMVEMIESEIVDKSPGVKWDDIAGLEGAKQALQEMVILPTLRSDLFQGLRKPARGLLLYGPPGTGKTMLAKAVASEAAATFFSVSASSLTSKWMGEGEKLMRALFVVAAAKQPSVIFIDEIDSILSARSASEHEASRRLKTEFLVQFDGVVSGENDRVIVMGATNRPQELDDAARRRLVKRVYIPLPDAKARRTLLRHLLQGQAFHLPGADLDKIVELTDGYSGSDLKALCQEAAMMPIRELGSRISTIRANQLRKVSLGDFQQALHAIRASVSKEQLREFEEWTRQYGSS